MKIVVLAGGLSTERDVSLVTGRCVYKALKDNGHRVILLDVFLGCEGDTKGIMASTDCLLRSPNMLPSGVPLLLSGSLLTGVTGEKPK